MDTVGIVLGLQGPGAGQKANEEGSSQEVAGPSQGLLRLHGFVICHCVLSRSWVV